MRRALITGIHGQDGSYLADFLLGKGYRVFGLCRKQKDVKFVELLYGDMRDEMSIRIAIQKSWPDEIYNLAGQSFVPTSWEMPEETVDVNTNGLLRILKICEQIKNDTRIYQASSSEMFGNHEEACTDQSPMNPQSPYGMSKLASHRLVGLYRERGLYCVSGILFNHESPRRGFEMVTRKIARQVAAWANGDLSVLELGTLDSRRDWGYAGEYVEGMWRMLQADKPDDYTLGTGVSHSVKEFLYEAAKYADVSKKFVDNMVQVSSRLTRTQEIFNMRADNSKIKKKLGWEPSVGFEELVAIMVSAEMEKLGLQKRIATALPLAWKTEPLAERAHEIS